MDFIEKQRILFPDLAESYDAMGQLFTKKLWHELTVVLEEFLQNSRNYRGNNIYELYTSFISKFESRLNQVRLAALLSHVGHSLETSEMAVEFFKTALQQSNRLGEEATLCLQMDVALAKLRLGEVREVNGMLRAAADALKLKKSSEPYVYSKFYKSVTEYRKSVGPSDAFYKSALMFLAYTPLESMPTRERVALATDMALAAMSGKNVYNFGEVLSAPILGALQGTANEWLLQLLQALNQGSIDEFTMIIDSHRDQFEAEPVLASCLEDLKQKAVLLCVMNLVFERPSHERTISFDDIANRTHMAQDQVEWILMKAFSLGLVRGTMDEVDRTANITWVQPRVLDNAQLGLLVDSLDRWMDRVKSTRVLIEEQITEL